MIKPHIFGTEVLPGLIPCFFNAYTYFSGRYIPGSYEKW